MTRDTASTAAMADAPWPVLPLGNCLQEAPDYGINAPAVPVRPGLPTYIRITDIDDSGRFRPRPKVAVDDPNADRYYLEPGDVVFARTGASVGKAYKHRANNGDLVFAGFLIRVKPNRSMLDPEFLFQYTQSKRYWDWVATMSMRSGQPGINGKEYASVPIPVPPIREQRAIAAALQDVDDLIESLERLLEKKQGVLTAARQSLLTRTRRLPSFGRDWRERALGDLCDVIPGGTPDTGVDAFWDGDIPWCTPTDITAGHSRYLDATSRTITRKGLKASSARKLPENALLLCTRATIGELKLARQPVATNQGFKSLVCGKEVDPVFLYFLLTQRRRDIEALGSGSTFDEVGTSDLKAMSVHVPELAEQRAIAEILADIDDEITLLRQRIAKTRQVKRGMMQELLTGRTRLHAEGAAA